jgi:bifunctional aspartokinase / homoserine dehydrogenase 1
LFHFQIFKLSHFQIMSATIVRVEGEISYHQPELEKLAEFLLLQNTPQILVTTALSEIYNQIVEQINCVHEPGYSSALFEAGLLDLGKSNSRGTRSTEYELQVRKLNELLKGIHLTGDYSPALKDQVLSFSEHLTALLLADKLQQTGRRTKVILPDQIELEVTPDFGNATFLALSNPDRLQLASDSVIIIPGSYGITSTGKITRAGRSAADYTAAFISAQLQADRLILWNLRTEFTSADTGIVPEAEVLKRLTYAEASELAYFEHFDFHPRTVEPLQKGHIPIHIIHAETGNFKPDTVINSEDYISDSIVKSIASTDDISVLRLNGPGVGLKPGILAQITGKLSEQSINIKSVITSQVSINILLGRKSGLKARQAAEELGFTSVNEIDLLDDVTLIAIVGHGMQDHYGISATLFTAVAENRINVILSGSGASDLVSYLVIKTSDKQKCVRAIYNAFFKS